MNNYSRRVSSNKVALETVLRIRFGFPADPDPAYYLNMDPDTDPNPGSQTTKPPMMIQADPNPDKTFKSQKCSFLHDKHT
jgi:hypothetical protein